MTTTDLVNFYKACNLLIHNNFIILRDINCFKKIACSTKPFLVNYLKDGCCFSKPYAVFPCKIYNSFDHLKVPDVL